jgi:hypothetical protein
MKYLNTNKKFTVEFEETIELGGDDDTTKVMVHINIRDHNKYGLSKELLDEIIDRATKTLSTFRIYHSMEGLIIVGKY